MLSTLLSTYLFGDLSPAALAPIARKLQSRQYEPSEFVFRESEPANALFVVMSGQLKEMAHTPSGDELVFEVFTHGAVFGEPALFAPERTRVVSVVAVEPATVLTLDRNTFAEFAFDHPQVMFRLLEGLAAQVRSLTEDIAGMAYRPIRERLIAKLLELADTHGHRGAERTEIAIDIPQATLASMVGASRENVNRRLAALVAAGAIETSSGRVTTIKPAELRTQAGFGEILHRRNRLTNPTRAAESSTR